MGNQQDGDTALQQLFEPVETFELEGRITYCQSFIDDQDIGIDMRRDGEGQTHEHAAGVCFYRTVDKLADVGKLDDGIKLLCYFPVRKPQQHGVEVDVLPAAIFGIEAGTQLQQRRYAPRANNLATSRT
ncbi:hypothetical protein D3C84_422880 [compost metagenome]